MRYAHALFVLLSIVFTTGICAASGTPTHAPKICVVLSGGGARGFAHIGVLRYLEQHHIPVHCIAGTSMGAVIGGLYASGLSADDIEQKMNAVNLRDMALDIVARKDLTQTLREDDEKYPIAGTFGLNKNGITLPLGAIQANQFLQLLHNLTAHIPPDLPFDQLPIPLRVVATDLESGNMVVFDKGPLHMAIRASMAAPGVFAPVEINGRLLTDGGLVRNLPVDIARSMSADVIIAVNIGTPLLPRDDLRSFLNISRQMMNILTEQNVNEQKKLLLPTDVLIDPDLGNIGFMDFDQDVAAAEIGYHGAQASQAQLAALELPAAEYDAQQKARPKTVLQDVRIAFVDVHSSGKIPAEDIRRQLNIEVGSIYDSDQINRRIEPLINSRQFDSLTQSLVQQGDAYGVKIDATERSWGPNFVRFGLAMSSGFEGQSGFELQIGHRLPWLTDSGLEWRNDLELGTIDAIRSELRQPLTIREGVYLAPYLNLQQKPLKLYSDNTPVAEYNMNTTQAGLDLGLPIGEFSRTGEMRVGGIATHYNLSPKMGVLVLQQNDEQVSTSNLPWVKMNEYAIHARYTVDQLDTPVFPQDGYLIGAEFFGGVNQDQSDTTAIETHSDLRAFQQLTVNGTWAQSVQEHSINISMAAGARKQSGSAIPGIGLSLGGFQRLTAYQPDQFTGDYLLYGNATYLYRALKFGLAGEGAFIGTSLEIGNAASDKSEFEFSRLKKSLSVFVGANTFMGPTHFGLAVAPAGAFNLFLQLGTP